MSSLNVAAQTALPDWVRARGLAIFLTVFFGSMALGSTIWGQVASATSVTVALIVAGIGALLAIVLTRGATLARDPSMELAPSKHWPDLPISDIHFDEDKVVMIHVAYVVTEEQQGEFRELMRELQQSRQSYGAYGWALRHDLSEANVFVETWQESSWLNHLRHHERVSKTEQQLQERIRQCLVHDTEPAVQHYTGNALVD